MITLQVNGRRIELEGPMPLVRYIEQLGIDVRAVAVEHNGEILERSAFDSTVLRDGDHVEIVRMVGGGLEPRPAPAAP